MIVPRDYPSFRIAIASAIARDYPIIIAWHVSNASMRLNNGFIVQGRGPGNHATFIHSGKFVEGKTSSTQITRTHGGQRKMRCMVRVELVGEMALWFFTMESLSHCRPISRVLGVG